MQTHLHARSLPLALAALLLASSSSLAQPASTPATPSTTTPARRPTPAELIEQIRARQKEIDTLPKVGLIELSGPVTEKPSAFSLFSGGKSESLLALLQRLESARDNKDLRALVIVINHAASMSLSQAAEIRDTLATFKPLNKRVFVYADTYNTLTYTLASGASDIVILEGGELFMPGIGIQNQFFKGLMDKFSVKGDYVQIGEFKGAQEPFTRSAPSDELTAEMNKLADALYNQIISGISTSRQIPRETVRKIVDDAILPARAARDQKLVDHLSDRDSLRSLVETQLSAPKINVIEDYGQGGKPELDFSNPFAFLAAATKRPGPTSRDTIAIVYADGTIVDGESSGGGLPIPGLSDGPSIGSQDIRQAMRDVKNDPNVKAVVIRIDSPGGSALASEVMWQSVRKVSAEKPVIISIGSMAASGGYYLASAGDYIVAEPNGIVGSIGVVGGKFVLSGLYDKLGITSQSYYRGQNADLFSSTSQWSDRQRKMVDTWMRTTYDQFTDRIMTTRKGKIANIDQVARGRVFVSADALALGMVDELGGLTASLTQAATRAKLAPNSYDVRVFPESSGSLADLFSSAHSSPSIPSANLSQSSLLHLLPADQRKSLSQQIRFIQLLQDRPIILHLPFNLTVR